MAQKVELRSRVGLKLKHNNNNTSSLNNLASKRAQSHQRKPWFCKKDM